MELRGQDKEIGMPSTLGYNSPNRDHSSSSKLTSPTLSSSSLGLGDRIRDQIGHGNTIFNPPHQTLEQQHHSTLSFQSHFQALTIPHQQPQKSRKDHDQDQNQNPDPVLPIPISTSSATTTKTILTASGSNFKTPPPPPPPSSTAAAVTVSSSSSVRYRECLKNHAATTGGYILDGCGEFMPSGDEGSSDSLICAACECHRNFHRKEIDGESQYVPNTSYYSYNPNKDINGRRSSIAHPQIPPQPPLHHHQHQHQHQHQHHQQQQQQRLRHYQFSSHGVSTSPAAAGGGGPIPQMMMAFGGGGGGGTAAESSSEDLNMFQSNYGVGGQGCSVVLQQASASKKRFRTKFSQPQKEKMMEFAEKLGWRIQKHDEEDVQKFCSEVGVKRKAFKVWMHNNKQTMKKKEV